MSRREAGWRHKLGADSLGWLLGRTLCARPPRPSSAGPSSCPRGCSSPAGSAAGPTAGPRPASPPHRPRASARDPRGRGSRRRARRHASGRAGRRGSRAGRARQAAHREREQRDSPGEAASARRGPRSSRGRCPPSPRDAPSPSIPERQCTHRAMKSEKLVVCVCRCCRLWASLHARTRRPRFLRRQEQAGQLLPRLLLAPPCAHRRRARPPSRKDVVEARHEDPRPLLPLQERQVCVAPCAQEGRRAGGARGARGVRGQPGGRQRRGGARSTVGTVGSGSGAPRRRSKKEDPPPLAPPPLPLAPGWALGREKWTSTRATCCTRSCGSGAGPGEGGRGAAAVTA